MHSKDLTKAALRTRVRTMLDALPESHWADASARICDGISQLDRFRAAKVVFGFVPIASEVDITPVLKLALAQGKVLCLPRIDWNTRRMVPTAVTSLDDTQLETTRHGIRQPNTSRPDSSSSNLDLILVPGLAFAASADGTFARLGRGAGFYDRFFESQPSFAVGRAAAGTLGIALKEQMLASIPADSWDVSVRAVATPDGVIGSV